MYGLEKPIGDMKFVVDTCYLAAMNTPGNLRIEVVMTTVNPVIKQPQAC